MFTVHAQSDSRGRDVHLKKGSEEAYVEDLT